MLSAIDAPKSKSITITFSSLKSMLFGLFLTLSFNQLQSRQECSDSIIQLSTVFKLFYILGSLLSLFLLLYFMFTKNFNKMEYYILYGYQLILLAFTLIVGIVQTAKWDDCSMKGAYQGTLLALSVVFVAAALVVMWANLYFGLKFMNFGCNLVWTFLWIQGAYCANFLVAMIGIIHGILSLTGLIIFLLLSLLRKNTKTAKCYHYLYLCSLICLLFCYILCWLAQPTSQSCQPALLLVLTYQKFGLLELMAPVLMLIFVGTEMGDPREGILRAELRSFGGGGMDRERERERGNFVIDDTN